jgi:hypothetical protein
VAPRAVFVSYSHTDHDIALAIVAHLESHEVTCWIAPRDITPGAEWAGQIVEAIAAASVMVLVLSSSANASPQVRREVERAVHRRLSVLPFRVEHVLPSQSLEYFLSSQQWLDAFPPPMEPHYARLTAHVKALLTGSAASPERAAEGPAPRRSPADALPDASALLRLETELARFIGPVARHLVQRAALRTTGVEELIDDLGREIDSDAHRQAFLNAARQSLRMR